LPAQSTLSVTQIIGEEYLAKDVQTVRPDGTALFSLIDGVREHHSITQTDERGSICEMFSTEWGFDEGTAPYVYQASLLPGYVKGWVLHRVQTDRLFLAHGRLRVVLFDGRTESPTFRQINRFEGGESARKLIRIPPGVYHAVQNLGCTEAFYFNMPTHPYRHESPDKFRLPLKNDIIPYQFRDSRGW
jgi:dTDP-4-dehydrorhamnose 3,5-epimerase